MQMRRILYSVLSLPLFCSSLAAQEFGIDTLRDVSLFYPDITYSFPLFRHAGNQAIADSVNRDMLLYCLEIEPETMYGNIFENVWGSEEFPMPRLADMTFEIIRNDDRVLSVAVSAEGCGAYCEYFTVHRNYDGGTGRVIEVTDLFTPEGMTILCDSLLREKRKEIGDYLAMIRDPERRKEPEEGEYLEADEEYFNETVSLYEGCLEWNDTLEPEYLDVAFGGSHILITLGRCSAHWNRAMDELWTFEYEVDPLLWQHHLNDYGRELFGIE